MCYTKSTAKRQSVKKISKDDFLNNKYLKKHKDKIAKPCLWDSNEKNIAVGAMIGSFTSLLPMPFQMFIATPLCVVFCGNIPIAISLVWVSNPITMPFIMYLQYLLGNYIMGGDNGSVNEDNIIDVIKNGVEPLLLGSILSAVVISISLYVSIRGYYYMKNKV